MAVLRFLFNTIIIVVEIAAAVAVAYAGYAYPFLFSAATGLVAFLLGLSLEAKRLRNELPFYFGEGRRAFALVPIVGVVEATMKGILAGLAALFTFAGTDGNRLFWVAVLFGLTVYFGGSLLRVLSIKLDALPARWGFFRLGPPLGLIFSAGVAAFVAYGLIPSPSVGDIGWRMVWEVPQNPSIEQVSELFFQLKQAFDEFVVKVLSSFLSSWWAQLIGIAVSVNVLTGFVASLYAAIISEVVRRAERALP